MTDDLQGLIHDPRVADIGTLVSMQPGVNAGVWGNYVLGSIHGRKFHDLNADGLSGSIGTELLQVSPEQHYLDLIFLNILMKIMILL